jgi:DNA-3-methyladenine glycosylase
MFGPAGHLYVYFTYGMHWCANVVTGSTGEASAVLLRAGQVVAGLEVARSRRGSSVDRDLARGPARLCQALGIDGTAYGIDLLAADAAVRLRLPSTPVPESRIAAGPRVGVTGAHDREWRFWIADDPTVSVYRRHTPRKRAQ